MIKAPTPKQTLGRAAEDLALAHLQTHGLKLLARNYLTRGGEVDLIMQHAQTLVFIEVRARTLMGFGTASDSVTAHKQKRIILAAQHYLQTHFTREPACRFDVVALTKAASGLTLDEWLQNAFAV